MNTIGPGVEVRKQIKLLVADYYKSPWKQRIHQGLLRKAYRVRDSLRRVSVEVCKPDIVNILRPQLQNVGDIAIAEGVRQGVQSLAGLRLLSLSIDSEKNFDSVGKLGIIVGGGSIVNDQVIDRSRTFLEGSKVSFFGVEVFGWPSDLRVNYPSNIVYTGVRSERSKDRVERFGCADARVVPDAAWLIRSLEPSTRFSLKADKRPVLGINMTSWPKIYHFVRLKRYSGDIPAKEETVLVDYVSWLWSWVSEALEAGWRVVFIPFEVDDYYFANAIFGQLCIDRDVAIFENYDTDPYRNLALVSELDLFIATRYHAHVFALMCGTPLISVPYSMQVTELIKIMGLPADFCYPCTVPSFEGKVLSGFMLTEVERMKIRRQTERAFTDMLDRLL